MLNALKNLLSELTGGKHPDRFEENDYRVAAAALLIHAATVEGRMSEAKRERLHAVLKDRFALDDAATAELIDEATAAESEAVDLYHFTSLINRALDEDGRRRVIEMLWQIVLADGRVSEFEDNLVWRAADLLNVSSRDRIALRQHVARQASDAGRDQ